MNIIINYITISKSIDNLIINLQSSQKSRISTNNIFALLRYENSKLVRVTNNVKKLKSPSIKIITNINHIDNATISSASLTKICIDFKITAYLIFNRDFI